MRLTITLYLFIFILGLNASGHGQEVPPVVPRVVVEPILDGLLTENTWDSAFVFTEFKTIQPDFGVSPSEETVFYLVRSETHLYVAFYCHDREPEKIRATLAKRDDVGEDDWVAFCLDSFNDETTAFFFLSNPLGIQMDGVLDANASPDITLDMIWQSKGRRTSDGYSVEMAIPFSSLRFRSQEHITMGFKVARNISRKSEEVDFPEYSPDRGAALGQFQKIELGHIRPGRALEIMPAFTYLRQAAHRDGSMIVQDPEAALSLNAKIGLGANLTLDATYNPDFSQVETDAGQIDYNLRAALYYPERRPFFLEGQQWYGMAGAGEEAPLQSAINTRNITDPRVGLKLSGKLGKKNILAALYALDEHPPPIADTLLRQSTHTGLIRYARNIDQDSYIGALATIKQNGKYYDYVAGADARWRLTARQHLEFHALSSFTNMASTGKLSSGQALSGLYFIRSRHWNGNTGIQVVSSDFSTQMGYLTRQGLTRIPLYGEYVFYFQDQALQRIAPYYWGQYTFDHQSRMWEQFNVLGVNIGLTRQSGVNLSAWLADEIFAGRRFSRNTLRFAVETRPVNQLGLEADFRLGNFIFYDAESPYGGTGKRIGAVVHLQPLPFLQSVIGVQYTDFFRQADGQKIYDYSIIRNRTTVQFNRYLFLRGIAEYNTFHKSLALNFLLSFTYIPGTVCYIGYGNQYEELTWQNNTYVESDRLLQTGRSLFFKFSYLFQVK